MAETYEQVERERDSMRMRLVEWNALALATFSLDSSALWPNGWRQEVAQVAWALHDTREQLAASQREREQLQARVDGAEKLVEEWRNRGWFCDVDIWGRAADELRTALAASAASPNSAPPVTSGDLPKEAG